MVSIEEAEEVFEDFFKYRYPDVSHSVTELREVVLGQTYKGRLLFVVFTIRQGKIRVISARDADKKERRLYGQNHRGAQI